jgi:glyoxylase-like metal-dependent hydrolase (beta-lactamase superfamily II)
MKSALTRSRPGAFDLGPASLDQAVRINDFIYTSTGASNAYLVVTPAGNVVINTGMGFEAPRHKRLFDAADSGPLKYIILTQGHVDHVGGVDVFRQPDTEVIAQKNNRECQADDERIQKFRRSRSFVFFAHIIRQAIRAAEGQVPNSEQAKPNPTIVFEDSYSFELGGFRFELFSVPGGETIDSLCVWLPQHRIVFTGNQFGPLFPHFPNFYTIRGDRYRHALPYIESLDRVLALEPEMLITGHFDPIRGKDLIREELTRLRAAVLYVHDETVRGMNDGKDVYTLMREIRLPEELEVGEGYGKVAWAVRAIWEGYAGWFQFRSATELYDVPAWKVYPEMVALAGGADVVAERAQARVAAGEPLEGLHLAEMALTAEPQNVAALRSQLAALELLLERSGGENFWEVGWLRHQIEETKRVLVGECSRDPSASRRGSG